MHENKRNFTNILTAVETSFYTKVLATRPDLISKHTTYGISYTSPVQTER